jgi:UDP-2,3-diacylglucosamine pyrophosphatase LpxH
MVIIATSDQHLGYANSDKPAFNAFLDQLQDCENVTDFVLLGDVVDMWRRDASGVFLENRDTFDRIASLQKNMNVHYVAGNHDFHVTKLKNQSEDQAYPFDFPTCLQLPKENPKYRFVHGYQFDFEQTELWSDALCRISTDTLGNIESDVWETMTDVWEALTRKGSNFQYSKSTLTAKANLRKKIERVQLKPEEGLAKSTLTAKANLRKKIERLQLKPEERLAKSTLTVKANIRGFAENLDYVTLEACKEVKSNEILVFGHTHIPYINKSGTVVNTGSWVKDSPVSNTYVKLDEGGPKIFRFDKDKGTDITDSCQH